MKIFKTDNDDLFLSSKRYFTECGFELTFVTEDLHNSGFEDNIMTELKDFQRATVERIDELYRQGQQRILVSDEVGSVYRGTQGAFSPA